VANGKAAPAKADMVATGGKVPHYIFGKAALYGAAFFVNGLSCTQSNKYMGNYMGVDIAVADADKREVVLALLADMGYEGFEERADGLEAFIAAEAFDETALRQLLDGQGLSFALREIAPQNWNAQWESGFEPVVVEGFVAVRASFHPPVPGVRYELIVTPKMSFGTGHHATTYMMLQQMARLDFVGKRVLDFGTGTGVLAILAEKMGADTVLAIDNDDWSIHNAAENIQYNGCGRIELQKADELPDNQYFDIVLANINLNVITANLPRLAQVCSPGASILLSGFLSGDEAVLGPLLEKRGLQNIETASRGNWLCMVAKAP
jgi:ribosomal protein L11 methyltransferase